MLNNTGQALPKTRRGLHHAAGEHWVAAAAILRRYWAPFLVAVSLNGFFVYLLVLDWLSVRPRTPLTAAYYAALGAMLAVAAWNFRGRLHERVRSGNRTVLVFAASAGGLAVWFLLNVALISEGSLSRKLAALLVLSALPTAILAAALEEEQLAVVGYAIVGLGLAFAAITIGDALRTESPSARLSPIAELNPISAAETAAMSAVAAFALAFPAGRFRAGVLACAGLLAGVSIVPAGRGPVVALIVAVVVMAFADRSRQAAIAMSVLAFGIAGGAAAASQVGSFGYFENSLSGFTGDATPTREDVSSISISSISIRRQWLEKAIRDTPERPLFGHGVGMLVDDTPEAEVMGVAGQRVYPHNVLVEAAYSLGALGLVLLLAFMATTFRAAAALARGSPSAGERLVVGLLAFAVANGMVSGEIGADAILWTTALVAVALYADRRSTASER